jgi:hypothetical protein
MKYIVGMASDGMTYVPSFTRIGFGIQAISSRTVTHSVYRTLIQVINVCYRNMDVSRGYSSYIRRKNASRAVSTEQF